MAVSMIFIIAMSLIAIIFGYIRDGIFTLAHVFNANFAMGAFFLIAAILRMIIPVWVKPGIMTDHTSIAEIYSDKRREKQGKAAVLLYLGLMVILFTGLIQLFLSFILR